MKRFNQSIEKSLLKALVEASASRSQSGVSIREIASILKVPLENVHIAILYLKQQGLVEVQELPHRILLASPTMKGIEQYYFWNKTIIERALRMLRQPATIILTALLTAAVGYLLYLFRLDPSSTNVRPRPITQSSIEVSNEFFGLVDYREYWQIEDVNAMMDAINKGGVLDSYGDVFSNAMNVTLENRLQLSFDVLNTDKYTQAKLSEMVIEFEYEPVAEYIDVFRDTPGLGAGEIRRYKAILAYDPSLGSSQKQTIVAKPEKDGGFDFTPLPGEKPETIGLEIAILQPGIYHVTPRALFQFYGAEFDGQEYEHIFRKIDVVVPRNTRMWFYDQGQITTYTFTSGGTGARSYEGLVKTPVPKPILFEESFFSPPCRIAIVDKDTVISLAETTSPDCGVNARWQGADRIIYEDAYWMQDPKIHAFNLASQQTNEVGPVVPTILRKPLSNDEYVSIEATYGHYSDVVWSPAGDFAAVIVANDDLSMNLPQNGKIVILDHNSLNFIETQAPNSCDSPTWSPSGQVLAFICRFNLHGGITSAFDPGELWVTNTDGLARNISFGLSNRYGDLRWSTDEETLLVGGGGIWIFQVNGSSYPITVVELPSTCTHCIQNPSWQP